MITHYAWKTPNGRKTAILLEELGLRHETIGIDITKDEQFDPAFLKISPNNKIPAIVDHDADGGPLTLFESGAILTYLADTYGEGRFLAASGHARWKALEWLAWQVGGLGPMFGQLGYFAVRAKEKVPHAIDRFQEESERLLGVLERRLGEAPYLAGADYSIADIAAYPWVAAIGTNLKPLASALDRSAATRAWLARIGERPAVAKGMRVLED